MSSRIWIILGTTSVIAEQFAHQAAVLGHSLILVGRAQEQLEIICQDIKLRYKVECRSYLIDFSEIKSQVALLDLFEKQTQECDLFLAQSDFSLNSQIDAKTISNLININIHTSIQAINAYLNLKQQHYCICYLSSVAACRGRAQNSLYGSSKAAVELYLEGLQQKAPANLNILIARLGFIDTKQTYGRPGIFYAAPPSKAAAACWKAIMKKKKRFYYPYFWKLIMSIISRLPFVIYRKLNF